MEKEELYPELAEYIFGYCGRYFWEKEKLANRHLLSLIKHDASNIAMYKMLQRSGWISSDPEVLELAKDGFDVYKRKVVERIFQQHRNELSLNVCPKCGKIARTPFARQCQFCFHDWH